MAENTIRHVVQGFDVQTYVTFPGATQSPKLSGKYSMLTATLNQDIEEYLETEEQIAEILPGIFTVEGELSRGWQDIDVVTRFCGLDRIERGVRIEVPRFIVTFRVNAPSKTSMNGALVTLQDCVFTSMNWAVSAGKGVVDWKVNFRASGFSNQSGALGV